MRGSWIFSNPVTYIHTYLHVCIHLCICFQFVAVAAILNVTLIVSSTNTTLECTLPCFSPDIQCDIIYFTSNNGDGVHVIITYDVIIGSAMSYSYPTQRIMISNLASDRSYYYCLVAINTANNTEVGYLVCGNFTTEGTYI